MKNIMFVLILIVVSISCEREEVSDNFLVGTWDLFEETDDGGNSWEEFTFTDVYIEFRDDGTFTESVGGVENHFHYQLCNNENLYRWKLQDANSESFVNENCDCDQYASKFTINTARTLLEEWGCNTNGEYKEKYEKR